MTIRRLLGAVAVALGLLASGASLAQTDPSLDDAYAQQCATNADSRVCQVLRAAIDEEMQAAANKTREARQQSQLPDQASLPIAPTGATDAEWGLLARLAGRDFYIGGIASALYTFRWNGSDSLIWLAVQGSKIVTTEWRRGREVGQLEYHSEQMGWQLARVEPDGSISAKIKNYDQYVKYISVGNDGQLRVSDYYKLQPVEPGSKFETRRNQLVAEGKLTPPDTDGAPINLSFASSPKGTLGADGVRHLKFGQPVATATDNSDRGSGLIWRVPCFRVDAQPGEVVRIDSRVFGERAGLSLKASCDPDGASYASLDNAGDRRDLSMIFVQGKAARYVHVWLRGQNKKYELRSRALSPQEYAQWKEQSRQAQLARAQQEAQKSDSGFFGALMMGTGAALGGGNAEQVMGMAMKGMEMTTDNEMSRNVLSGQGDAMVAAGTERMMARNEQGRVQSGKPTGGNDAGSKMAPPVTSRAASPLAGGSGMVGTRMYGWCYATAGANYTSDKRVYYSQIGHTDRYWKGVTTDDTSRKWQTRMEEEFQRQLPGGFYPTCYAQPQPSGFDYNRNAYAGGDNKVIEVDWAPN